MRIPKIKRKKNKHVHHREYQKSASHELREEHARLTDSVNSLPLGFFIIDKNEKVSIINPAMKRILGSARKKWTVESLEKRLGNAFDFRKCYKESIKKRKHIEFTSVSFGNKFLRIRVSPIALTHGVAVVVDDITEAKTFERMQKEFFAIASHELRTPLTAIRGNADLLRDYFFDREINSKDAKEMITDMHTASVRMIKLVNDFLDIAKLEQGKEIFKKEKVDLVPLLQESLRVMEKIAEKKRTHLVFKKPKTHVPPVFGDRERIEQVVINLVGNALKFTKKGKVSVKIKIQKDFLEVFVEDTGSGIPLRNQKTLFRKFQQTDGMSLKRDRTKSSGLGLYISKLLVEGMGGTIAFVKSKSGAGSVFRFTLPVMR